MVVINCDIVSSVFKAVYIDFILKVFDFKATVIDFILMMIDFLAPRRGILVVSDFSYSE